MDCIECGQRLNSTRWSTDGNWKACPHCSDAHGSEHVYYEFPNGFGETPARASISNPNGPQSYCVSCRGKNEPSFVGARLCSALDSTPKQPL